MPIDDALNARYVIESQRGHHTATGNIFYWDPVNGLDGNDGLSPSTAKQTWNGVSGIDSLLVAQNHDLVIIIPGEPGGITVITEQIMIDKEYTFIRGSGRDIRFKPTATTGETVSVEAEGVELSGVRIETADSGDGEALVINGSFPYIHDIWVENSQGDGIRLQNVSYSKLENIFVRNCLGNGITFRGTVKDCKWNTLSDCLILNNSGDGVLITGILAQHNYIWGGEGGISIMENGGWGVNETDSANLNHAVGPVIHIHENVAGEVNFTGVDSQSENVGEFWERDLEGGLTAENMMRVMLGVLSGTTTVENIGGGLSRVTFKSLDGLTDRAIVDHDAKGRRSVSTLDGD